MRCDRSTKKRDDRDAPPRFQVMLKLKTVAKELLWGTAALRSLPPILLLSSSLASHKRGNRADGTRPFR
jgi:hypothetical protein